MLGRQPSQHLLGEETVGVARRARTRPLGAPSLDPGRSLLVEARDALGLQSQVRPAQPRARQEVPVGAAEVGCAGGELQVQPADQPPGVVKRPHLHGAACGRIVQQGHDPPVRMVHERGRQHRLAQDLQLLAIGRHQHHQRLVRVRGGRLIRGPAAGAMGHAPIVADPGQLVDEAAIEQQGDDDAKHRDPQQLLGPLKAEPSPLADELDAAHGRHRQGEGDGAERPPKLSLQGPHRQLHSSEATGKPERSQFQAQGCRVQGGANQ